MKWLVFVVAVQITVEIRGLKMLDGNTTTKEWKGDEYLHNDYISTQSSSLIQNPNIRKKPSIRPRTEDDCSDEVLRRLMDENITNGGMSESKRNIHSTVRQSYEGSWSVICAPCAFSYITHAQDYCIHSKYGITCLLYRDG